MGTVYFKMNDTNEILELQEKIIPIMKSYSNITYLPKYDTQYIPPINDKTRVCKTDRFNPDNIENVLRSEFEMDYIKDKKFIVELDKIAKVYSTDDKTVNYTELFEGVKTADFTPKSDDKYDVVLYFRMTPTE